MSNATDLSAVICATLAAEYGEAAVAQIGIFERADREPSYLPAAQHQFTEMLAAAITASSFTTARILLVGAALEPVVTELSAQTSTPEWITDLFAPVSAACFDCVVVAGSYSYQDQLAIFNRCRELLGNGGTLFIYGEYLADDSLIEHSALANLSSQRQLSARLGFQGEKVWDLTAHALQSVTRFLPLLDKHAESVCAALSLNVDTWKDARNVLDKMRGELNSGRRVYQLQQWSLPKVVADEKLVDRLGEYAHAEYGDITSFSVAEIGNLFEQSFEKKFDAELWHWKYQLGNGKCVVARISRGGEIVAHYGGAPRDILFFGEPSLAIQVCDVMVLPEKRRQYGKNSLFFKVAATFLEREIGNTVGHLLGFGFPNQSAMNIATRLGLYEKTDDFVEIIFAAEDASQSVPPYAEFDAADATHVQQVDQLWDAMARGFSAGIIGARNAAYLKYRYFDHPGAARGQYRCLLLHAASTHELLAFVALKQHGDSQLLLDLICPQEQIPTVISAVNQLVKAEYPGHHLRLWLTRGWLGAIPLEAAIVKELNIEIPCNSWNPGPDSTRLYGKWWLTAGDMDFM